MNIQHKHERYFEEPLWLMDSECCCKCGALLDYFETEICADCLENERYSEEQDTWDGWGSDWDVPVQERESWQMGINDEYCWMHTPGGWTCVQCRLALTMPAFFEAASWVAQAAVLESAGEA